MFTTTPTHCSGQRGVLHAPWRWRFIIVSGQFADILKRRADRAVGQQSRRAPNPAPRLRAFAGLWHAFNSVQEQLKKGNIHAVLPLTKISLLRLRAERDALVKGSRSHHRLTDYGGSDCGAESEIAPMRAGQLL